MTDTELEDERGFLLASLEDLEREHAAGDLSDTDYVTLRDRYTRRAAQVLRALDGDGVAVTGTSVPTVDDSAPPAPGPPVPGPAAPARRARRRPALAVVGGLAVLVAAAAVVVTTDTGSRLPGQTPTGSVSLSRPEQIRRTLAQAESLELANDGAGALRLFDEVITQDPTQAEALAQAGWLEFEAGVAATNATVTSEAVQLERRAARAAPHAYAPHLYLGSMLLAQGNPQAAVVQLRAFLADDPPAASVRSATPFIVRAFTAVGQPVPALPS